MDPSRFQSRSYFVIAVALQTNYTYALHITGRSEVCMIPNPHGSTKTPPPPMARLPGRFIRPLILLALVYEVRNPECSDSSDTILGWSLTFVTNLFIIKIHFVIEILIFLELADF